MNTHYLRMTVLALIVAGALAVSYYLGSWQRLQRIGETAAIGNDKDNQSDELSKEEFKDLIYGAHRGNSLIGSDEFVALMRKDPVRGLAELAKLAPGPETLKTYEWAFAFLGGTNHASEVAAVAIAMPPGPERSAALKGLAEGWANSDPHAALEWAGGLPASESEALKNVLLGVSTQNSNKRNPALAAQYLDKLQDAAARDQVIQAVARVWGVGFMGDTVDADPAAALTWLDKVATGATYDNSVKYILNHLSWNNPDQAAVLLEKVTEPGVREAAIAELAKSWGNNDPKAALAWAQTLLEADTRAREAALGTIFAAWLKSDQDAAFAYAQSSPDTAIYLAAAPAIAQIMSKTDPQGALAWVNNLPASSAKDQAVANVLTNLATADFPLAWNYVTTLPQSAGRDTALQGVVTALGKSDSQKAITLIDAEQYTSTAAMQSAARAVALDWGKKDPDALAAWIDNQPLSPKRNAAVTQLVTVMTDKDPARALNYANLIGNRATRLTNVQKILTTWAAKDPQAALAAVQSANLTDAERANLIQSLSQKTTK